MSKKSVRILLCIFFLIPAACARQVIRSVPAGDVSKEQTVERPAGPEIPVSPKSPGELASLQLTDQARRFLESGNAESAIRVLERSVALHPYNGEGYFLLAEAWILKKDTQRALSFHRIAQTYLKGEPSWEERILDQHQKILRLK
jgi:cytochrome c-type biogenesis protein CcmH/NrfG